ncbi:response regulator transcription factor [Mucilaginibacter sp. E4BP6]|uniref:response regulator transcription factor n=1 Tax=Mucilaginibacter sp. E4BP6 TaxID=2723089 RepID=UPI0015CB50A9|nr:response regulator transcription factor [Mucilaginibacter sp. E4BP6]NYE68404.1 DNA-binding NarL/FixJ family response regulator [Mucilaginibacter sp. E4BP6]
MKDSATGNSINMAILDEDTLIRKAIVNLINNTNDLNVLIDVGTSEELFKTLKDTCQIDVLLINVFSSISTTITFLENMKTKFPNIRTVLIINRKDPGLIGRLIDTGIYGCISKTSEPAELIFALRCAHHKKIYQNILFTEALYWKTNAARKPEPINSISDKHKRLLVLLWQEKTTAEISDEICLGVSSIEKMKQYLKEELGVKSIVGLIKYAINHNIISVDQLSLN